MSRRRPARARGQIIVWVAVMLPLVFLPIVGLSIDAGQLFDARRDLQNVADGAARSGGMQIDLDRLHELNGGDGRVRLNHTQAIDTANDYLDQAHIPNTAQDRHVTVEGDNERIVVTVRRRVQPSFLRLAHVGPVRIEATSSASPCSGLLTGSCPGQPGATD